MGFMEEMQKAIGANDAPTTVNHWLDTGHPLMNEVISGNYHGGLPGGRIIELFGDSSTGKTAMATKAMIQAQRQGGVAAFMDHENSFDTGMAENIGLDTSERWLFRKPDTYEESFDIAIKAAGTIREKKLIDPKAPIIFVFDSLASMVPKSKWDKDAENYNMNDNTALARATSANMPSVAQFCERNNFTVVLLNQTRTKIGVMFGDPTTTPGGDSPKFYATTRIGLSRAMITKGEGKEKQVIGQKVTAKTVKNKAYRPFLTAKWDFVWDEDGNGFFDPVGAVIDHLLELKVLEKSGNYIMWDGKKLYREQLVKKINESGDRLQIYKLLPNWDDDRAAMKSDIDWNKF